MSSEKKLWLGLIGGGCLVALGCGALIYNEYTSIAEGREQVARLRVDIESARKLLIDTKSLEREVIVLRETEGAIQEILPDEEDVNNFVRELRRFEEESEVRIRGLKKKSDPRVASKQQNAFDKVAYQLTIEADAFQLLTFLDRIESHSRFMRVPNFKLSAASRRKVEELGKAAHKVTLDVETFVYEPKGGQEPVKIEGYERKRELLLGEVNRRRQALAVDSYDYRGARGRRDPWVDPRVPANGPEGSGKTIEEQAAIVEELVVKVDNIEGVWEKYSEAGNVVLEMTLRAELEQKLTSVEEELRRLEAEGCINYIPSEARLRLDVIEPVTLVRSRLTQDQPQGPDVEALRELLGAMTRHMGAGEYELALNAFKSVEDRLEFAEADQKRASLVRTIRKRADEAGVLVEFSKRDLTINGVAIMEDKPPVILINGKALGEGDLVDNELVIRGIRPGEVEFIFKGLILVRRF